jgi:hypothetical protein
MPFLFSLPEFQFRTFSENKTALYTILLSK